MVGTARRRRPTPAPGFPSHTAQRGGWSRRCIPEAALPRLKIWDTDGAASLPIITRCFRSNFRSLVSTFPRHPDALQFLLAMTAFTIQFCIPLYCFGPHLGAKDLRLSPKKTLIIMANPNVTELTDANFDSFIKNATAPVLVDFWAPWCAPCRMLGPIVDEVATENVGKFAIAKVNVDEAPTVSAQFGIRSIPSLIYFKSGAKQEQSVGISSKAEIVNKLTALL
jgi:thioredoxin 1